MQSVAKWCGWICLLIVFGGCSAHQKVSPSKPPSIVPLSQVMPKPTPKAPGSLYTGYDNLFSDAKAYNVGDVVTILVNENIRGTGQTNTKAQRSNKMDLSVPAPTVMDRKVTGKTTLFGLGQKSTNSFQGKGGTNRSTKLLAKISARVVKVYPNGNMFIVGKKMVKINDDTQYLKISGIVNPRDIAANNTIDSSKVSDMYVEYNGQGFMNQTQKPGWLANFLMQVWPF